MPKSPDLLNKLRIKRKHEASLLQKPGVVGVSLGLKHENGKRTKDHAIRVLVRSSAEIPPDLPNRIEGLPVEPVVVGSIRPTGTGRFRPLLGGASIGQEGSDFYGTMGMVVTDAQGSAMALTNFHVLSGNVCALSTSARVTQPAPGDGGQEVIASVARWKLDGGSSGIPGVDAAVANIPPSIPVAFGKITEVGDIRGIASAALGELLTKNGRTSNTTYGVVTDISSTLTIAFEWGNIQFFDQVSVTVTAPSTIVATSGDSGAVWINPSGKAVGLHFASNAGHTIGFANPMHAVADRLSIGVRSPVTADSNRTYRVRAD